jgi:cell wall-associated NlpC family hydrolase
MILACMVTVVGVLITACTPCSPGKTDAEQKSNGHQQYDDDQCAQEPELPEPVVKLLALLETCVGGQYVIGGQGDRITEQFLKSRQREKPGAFTTEQMEYLSGIARDGEALSWRFPEHYAWDCSGLWWWGCNELGLYPEYTDCTAYITCRLYCTPILKEDLQPGDLVFYQSEENRIVHMGIVGRDGYVFEAVSVCGGVVKKRTIDERVYDDIVNDGQFAAPEWNVFGRPKIFEQAVV